MIENLNAEFPIMEGGIIRPVRSFGEGKQTLLPDGIGRRTAYRFNFSDQHVIPRTLSIDSASTWVCFDSALVTSLFALTKKVRLVSALRSKGVQDMLVQMLKRLNFGSDKFVIQVEATGVVDGQETSYKSSLSGHGEGRITGLVAAEVAERLYTSSCPAGVFHTEQLFDPVDFIEKFTDKGLDFTHG